ncbi:beta-galactosidase [Actinomadura sp. ATCC 31491]|uniref:Beta-galactosidase n=1 Tax=Actinomadura luzonensis TaxID=2805427 RepID=A0ABT0FWH3_9ACTN|nr:beta-galactosidase [Actinomadura luzonensis]MCK2216513.1 beta-galactosidase [Actinomadura luzonensis]
MRRLTEGRGLLFGGDYNPEQWPEEVWAEDVELMRAAGVNLVTVGVFSWARLEPEPGARDFGWLDRVMDLMAGAGIAVDLATPTASPPPWLGHRWPETLPVDASGHRLWWGSRNQFCPSSPVYRERALELVSDLAARYAGHPALALWHVGNEYGQVCHCDVSAQAFRAWLERRYGGLDALNEAWGTTFWSQRYAGWEEILPPRRAPYMINPTQSLDWWRFCSDALLEHFRAERDVLRAHTPDVPVTTNFMGLFKPVNSWAWAAEEDVVSNDWYPDPGDPLSPARTALVHDLMRGLSRGRPWLLMEQATNGVNWRPHNLPKPPGQLRLESLQALARGADGLCYFQWRASRFGAERFHAAMVPHAGPETRLHREVRAHGQELRRLAGLAGQPVPARVALVFGWESWWALEERGRPSDRLNAAEQLLAYYLPLWERGVSVDVVPPGADLSGYALVVVPNLFLVADRDAAALTAYARGGGVLVVGPFSGVVDPDGHIRTGRFPAPLRDVLGASGEEWLPVEGEVRCRWTGPRDGRAGGPQEERSAALQEERSTASQNGPGFTAGTWTELMAAEGAEPVAEFTEGDLAGRPAILRHRSGDGIAWYVATMPEPAALAEVVARALADAGVRGAVAELPPGVEAVRRGEVLFLLNHGSSAATVPVPGRAEDLLTGAVTEGGPVTLAPRAVVALRHHT